MKKTVVIGASPNPERYAYQAVRSLNIHGHEVIAVGLRSGEIDGITIHIDMPVIDAVDTISLYVGPAHQSAWFDYMESLHPKRLILNPGTESKAINEWAKSNNIEVEEACTLVLLSIGAY
jgi:predicted CoA-binding protein